MFEGNLFRGLGSPICFIVYCNRQEGRAGQLLNNWGGGPIFGATHHRVHHLLVFGICACRGTRATRLKGVLGQEGLISCMFTLFTSIVWGFFIGSTWCLGHTQWGRKVSTRNNAIDTKDRGTTRLLFYGTHSCQRSTTRALYKYRGIQLCTSVFPDVRLAYSTSTYLRFVRCRGGVIFVTGLSCMFCVVTQDCCSSTLTLCGLGCCHTGHSIRGLKGHFFITYLNVFGTTRGERGVLIMILLPHYNCYDRNSTIREVRGQCCHVSIFAMTIGTMFSHGLCNTLVYLHSKVTGGRLVGSTFFTRGLYHLNGELIVVRV